jgi:CHAT domain-containing protein/Tfp pilus assembly protein PilF
LPQVAPGRAEAPRRDASQIPVPEQRLAATRGTVLEAHLAGSRPHAYRIDLAAGQYADLTIDQRGVDAVVVLRAPDGHLLRRVDSLNGAYGPEPVPFIAGVAGGYRVEVRSPQAGAYAVVVEDLGSPTPRDRSRVAAEEAFAAGEELRRRGRDEALRKAVEQNLRALALFRSIGATDRQADVLLSLGSAFSDLGEYPQAREAYGRALDLDRAAGRTRQLLPVLTGLGRAHRRLGETEDALRCYREALSLSRKAGSRWDEITTLGNLGRVYATLGKAEEALAFQEQALAGWRELGVAHEEAMALDQIGKLDLALGDERQAIDRFEEALSVLEKSGEAASTGAIVDSLGSAYVKTGQVEKGIEYFHRALRLHRAAGKRHDEAVTLNTLGWACRQAGRLEQARRYYALALDLHGVLGDRSEEANTLLNLGGVHVALGEPAAAVRFYQRAHAWFVSAADPAGEAAALFGFARARRQQGDLAAARDAIEGALERIESLRTEPASSELRASYFASKQQYLAFYIDLLMELHHDAQAFEASERLRARSLLEELAEAGEPRSQGALAAEEAELGRRLHALEMRRLALPATAAAEQREVVDRELRRVLDRHRRVRAALRGGTVARTARTAVSRARPLRLAEVQRRVLDRETLLLEFFLGEERSFLWVVTPASLESFQLPGRATIEAAVRDAYELLPESHERTAQGRAEIALQDLSRLLLAPLGDRLAGRRLLVVADGVLHYVPFAALPVPARETGAGGLVPLMVDHEIVMLPSASTAAVLRDRCSGRPSAPATVAVLADPVFGRSPEGRFPRLPFSRLEAEAILNLVPAGRRKGMLGFEASRENVLRGGLASYRYVHFATHGILDTAYPELSGLLLSLVDRQGRPENGFLWAHEIADLRLGADLVVLSACQTALGKEIRGEGLVGLTQAFLDAGADGVLVSLWQVDDRATAELMRRLYEGMLREGLSPAAALRQAQIALWRGTSWQAPSYWAGFALQGEAD